MNGLLPKLYAAPGIIIATPLFFLFFVGVIVWIFRKDKQHDYECIGRLPLEDSDESENCDGDLK